MEATLAKMTVNSNPRLVTYAAGLGVTMFLAYKLLQPVEDRFVMITGANKGLGFGIAKYLLENTSNYHVILTGRNKNRLDEAYNQILNIHKSYSSRVIRLTLDVTKIESVSNAASNLEEILKKQHDSAKLYCIVNNAGISANSLGWTSSSSSSSNTKITVNDNDNDNKNSRAKLINEIADNIINTNIVGTINVIKYFGHLLDEKYSKIVNMSSGGGSMNVNAMSKTNKKKILYKIKNEKDLLSFVNHFKNVFKNGEPSQPDSQMHSNGFKLHCYGFSKACINCLSCNNVGYNILREKNINVDNIIINCCTPGLVDTDMSKNIQFDHTKKKTVEQGIQTPIQMILNNKYDIKGAFFGDNCCQYRIDKYKLKH